MYEAAILFWGGLLFLVTTVFLLDDDAKKKTKDVVLGVQFAISISSIIFGIAVSVAS